jgi:hypothetical protein
MALAATAAVIPACSLLPGGAGAYFASNAAVAPAGPTSTGVPYWNDANNAVPGPIGIVAIGGVEVDYADVDPATYGNTAEGAHPVSESRSLDPAGEQTITSAILQQYPVTIGVGGFDPNNPAGFAQGPILGTGDTKLAGISRGRAKHNALHNGIAPDPGGIDQRLKWMMVNPAYTNPQSVEVWGSGMTAATAATLIINGPAMGTGPFVRNAGSNQYIASGYWTSGVNNFYVLTGINLISGGP